MNCGIRVVFADDCTGPRKSSTRTWRRASTSMTSAVNWTRRSWFWRRSVATFLARTTSRNSVRGTVWFSQGVPQSRKVMKFSKNIFQAWNVMENNIVYGDVMENDCEVLEFYNYLHTLLTKM